MPANTESQQILALQSVLKKPQKGDEELQKFRAKVTADQAELKNLLRQGLQDAERSQIHRREVVVKTILHTLDQPPSKETTNPTRARDNRTTNLAVSTHPTYASAMEIVHASRNLLKDYEDMSQKLSASSPKEEQQIADEWQKNVDHTSRILQIGYKKALKDVESIIGIGHTETEGDKDTEMTDQQDDGEVEDGELMKRQCDTGLEKTLRYAERGVKRLAKGLPDDTPV